MDMASTWAEAEFETIFREHFARMVRMIRRVLRCDVEAEEICAEAFLKLYRMGPRGIAEGTAGAWLYRVATRSAIDQLRRHKRRGFEEQLDAGTDIADGLEGDPLSRLVREERIAEVRFALARLKVEKAQVLLLRHSGLSYQEIAAATRISRLSRNHAGPGGGGVLHAVPATTAAQQTRAQAAGGEPPQRRRPVAGDPGEGGMMKHNEIDTGMLRAYLDGEVNGDRVTSLSEHVNTCAECQAELKVLSGHAASVRTGLDYLPQTAAAGVAPSWSAMRLRVEQTSSNVPARWSPLAHMVFGCQAEQLRLPRFWHSPSLPFVVGPRTCFPSFAWSTSQSWNSIPMR